jgi:hypothetical protein
LASLEPSGEPTGTLRAHCDGTPIGIRLTRLQDPLGHPGRIVRIGIECGVAAELAMRRDVRGDDRRAVGQRLGYGEPETFGEGG